jgi:O-antigen/teichoic acid export membrane protein
VTPGRSARALRSTLVVTGLGYAAQALSLVAIPLFLRTVGDGGYGLMVTVMALLGYLGFADAGLSWGSMILIAQSHGRGSRAEIAHIVRHSAVLAAVSGSIVLLAVGAILGAASAGLRLPMFAGHPEADRLVLIGGIQLALSLQFSVVFNIFQGLQQGYWTGIYQGLGRILGLAGAMIAAWFTQSVAVMMLAQLAFVLVGGAAATFHAWRQHPWAFAPGPWRERAQFVSQVRIGAKNFLLQIGRTLGGTAPTLAIGSVLGPAAVPFYTVPTTLLSMFFTPINSWNANMQSAYGEAWESGDKDWVRGAFRISLERALVAGGLGVALFLSLGDRFIRLWTHGRLSMSHGTAASVAAITTMAALVTAGQFLLTGLNRHRRAAIAEICNGVIALVLTTLSVRLWGLGSVGIGVVGAALVTSAWVIRQEVIHRVGDRCLPPTSFVLRSIVASAVGAGAAACASTLGQPEGLVGALLQLAAGGVAGVATYSALAFVLELVALRQVVDVSRRLFHRAASPVP